MSIIILPGGCAGGFPEVSQSGGNGVSEYKIKLIP